MNPDFQETCQIVLIYCPEHILKIAELSVEQLARVIVNIELWKGLNPLQQQAVAAIHLKQSQLMQLSNAKDRPIDLVTNYMNNN